MGSKISRGFFLTWILIALFLPQYYSQFCQTEECLNLTELRSKKQTERKENLNKLKQKYPNTESSLLITDLPFDQLRAKLQTRELKATEVLSAYLAKAINATESFNCVTEFSPEAITVAEYLDVMPTVKGPLHGIPFCVNDNHDIKGMDSTLGYSKNLYKPAKTTAAYIKTLEDLGAIPFCKTNLPQTMLSMGSDNPIFGATANPLNPKLTVGGSSGASCLVATGGVKFASGTDMAGCIRFAAHFTGISGIKTTEGRLSAKGVVAPIAKVVGLSPATGFLAEDPKTLTFVLKELLENNRQVEHDSSSVLPIPWNSSLAESTRPLRIGYVTSYPVFPAMGQTEATLLKAKVALESRGHNLTSIEMIDSYEAIDVVSDLIMADGGASVKKQLQNDEVSSSIEAFRFVIRLPYLAKRLISFLPVPDRMKMLLTPGAAARRSDRLWDKIKSKTQLREDILNFMDKHSMDVIITPAFPIPATTVEYAPYTYLGVSYTCIWNLVEFPAGVVTFGMENGTDVSSYNDEGDPVLMAAKHNYPESTGMPIGVQVIGRPYQDELVLRVMSELYSSK